MGNEQEHVPVQILYFEGCPNHPSTRQRVQEIAARLNIAVELSAREVTSNDNLRDISFRGSPTILIEGKDVDPAERTREDYGFGCRTYGGDGMPSETLITNALQRAARC